MIAVPQAGARHEAIDARARVIGLGQGPQIQVEERHRAVFRAVLVLPLDEVKRLMLTPVNGEITEREPYDGYLISQGAIPEVQEFLSKIMR